MNIVIMTAPPRDTQDLEQSTIGAIVRKVCDWQHAGAFHTAIRAFEQGLEMGGPFTIIQDDVLLCWNFVPYVKRLLSTIDNENLVVSWFDVTRPMHSRNEAPRWYPSDPSKFRMTQAVTYSRRWGEQIFKFLCAMPKAPADDRGAHHGDDSCIRQALQAYKKPWLYHSPSLVQHIGLKSLVAPGVPFNAQESRVSKTFVGVDFDVMQWPKIL